MMAWLRPLITLAAIVGAIAVNGYSNVNPPNGINVGEMSNTVFAEVLLTPANYAFAIWGLIYVGLLALGIYQLQPSQHRNPRFQPYSYFLVLASLAQCLWIYLFLSQQFVLSLIAMVEILLLLLAFYLRINGGADHVQTHRRRQRQGAELGIDLGHELGLKPDFNAGPRPVSRGERWCLYRPLSLYLGWISIATVLNVALTLFSRGWGGWGLPPLFWTVLMMGVAAELGVLMTLRRQDGTFSLVVVWALVAIALGNLASPIIAAAGFGLAAALGLLVFAKTVRP